MAIIYKLALPNLRLLEISDSSECSVDGFFMLKSYKNISFDELDELKRSFVKSDTFHTTEAIASEIHSHSDDEVRMILKGCGKFYIPVHSELYIIECSTLDFIQIYKDIIHWFSSSGEILALRAFKNRQGHVENMPTSIASNIIKAKNTLDQYSYKFLV